MAKRTDIHIEPGGTLSVAVSDAVESTRRIWITDDFSKRPEEAGAGHYEDQVVVERYGLHRHVVTPLSDLSRESAEVQAAAAALWTPEFVAAYKAAAAAQED